jgi:hypothetical protein
MDAEDRPEIRALIGYRFPGGALWLSGEVFTLEEAAEASRWGFAVVVDPADERALEQWLEARRPRLWNRW